MDDRIDVREMAKNMARIAARTQAAINAVPQGNGRPADPAPVYPHLSKPKHTTSYVSYVSVPEETAAEYSAAVGYLWELVGGYNVNAGIIEAVLQHARACGFTWPSK